ncbi:14878_t:CDS:2 [Funneliformis mosseae]|uniref:14878_t:CDS:1 n=1 Tax=Funneliformis mosseae TaxID=27381 RepID=A0A9N8VYD8_FUNMO|nr:14878_t:CDS:2 [Funneliformis mosseae]
MMTGQIISGAPIMVAVRYQQIIMFMISASTALGVLTSIIVCVFSCIDSSHRLRTDRISSSKPWIFAMKDELLNILRRGMFCLWKKPKKDNLEEESLGLLSSRVET